jgi:hypothetical protein
MDMNKDLHALISSKMTELGYVMDANSIFKLKTQEGVPLTAILLIAMEKGIDRFPWYGYARRMWHSGADKGGIIADIKEAVIFNRWPEPMSEIASHLSNLWPDINPLGNTSK